MNTGGTTLTIRTAFSDGGASETGPAIAVTSIETGETSTCAVLDGSVHCWGDNSRGQFGNGDTESNRLPLQAKWLKSGVTSIAVGAYNTCAIVNGSTKCWGYNAYGQLGDNTMLDSAVPVQVLFP